MAGLTLIALLAPAIRGGLKVTLIDPAQPPNLKGSESPSFDDRATALSAHSLKVLQGLGLSHPSTLFTPLRGIEVSDRGHFGYHRFNAENLAQQQFGAVVANRALGQALWRQVQSLPVNWQFGTAATKLSPLADGMSIQLDNDQQMAADLVLLCDGGRSPLTDQLGLTRSQFDFDSVAHVASVKTERAHQGWAFERFTADGPIALLPFGEFSTLVWTQPVSQAMNPNEAPERALEALNQKFGQRLGRITQISQCTTFPLIEQRLARTATHHLAVLGNGATTLHPVAGQGFNLALRGLQTVAQTILTYYERHQKVPDYRVLAPVMDGLESEQQQLSLLTRQLVGTFRSKNPLVQLSRGVGLNMLDRHAWFSHAFTLYSMGLTHPSATSTLIGEHYDVAANL